MAESCNLPIALRRDKRSIPANYHEAETIKLLRPSTSQHNKDKLTSVLEQDMLSDIVKAYYIGYSSI